MPDPKHDRRMLRGAQSRQAILRRTVEIASLEGLEALSLGRLASELNLSKSGVFALFGSKEALQIATVHAAREIYLDTVVRPALRTPPGLARVWALCHNWLEYSRTRVFPGGCFFFAVSAEFDARPGPVRDLMASGSVRWMGIIEGILIEARDLGEIIPGCDAAQLAFELAAFLEAANGSSVLHDDPTAYGRARRAILHRLSLEATAPSLLPTVAAATPAQGAPGPGAQSERAGQGEPVG